MATEKIVVKTSDVPEVPEESPIEAIGFHRPYYWSWYSFVFPTKNREQVTEELRAYVKKMNQ